MTVRQDWRSYNRRKQWEYRTKRRGSSPRNYVKWEDVVKAEGHCGCCGMLLDSEYHKAHPLVGCLRWAEKNPQDDTRNASETDSAV